jgi:hypothetical protein
MRITTFDLDQHSPCGIEVPIRRLAASPEPLEAAYWHKLLELVAQVQSSDCENELWGQILIRELLLRKPEPPDPVRSRQMKEFLNQWRAMNPDPTSWGDRLSREIARRFPSKPGVCVSVRVDWQDHAPLREGLPVMHYRLQVAHPWQTITKEARTQDPTDAERIISEAFGW